jgi:hypothetical protein
MGHELAARYSFITNKLRYCGPHDSYIRFLQYINKKDDGLKKEIRESIERFEGLYPYIFHIAKKHNKDFLDYDVVESYWIGNSLLDSCSEDDLRKIIMHLSERGLPRSYAKKLCNNIPTGMIPHHSFNVIYVGVGKVTGSVPTNIENINNCLIRPGEVVEIRENTALIKHTPYSSDNNRILKSESVIEEFDYLPLLTELQKGDTVSVHWKLVVDKLTAEQKYSLEKYTNINVHAMNSFNEFKTSV